MVTVEPSASFSVVPYLSLRLGPTSREPSVEWHVEQAFAGFRKIASPACHEGSLEVALAVATSVLPGGGAATGAMGGGGGALLSGTCGMPGIDIAATATCEAMVATATVGM